MLTYWPATPGGREPTCDELENATCAGLAMCFPDCGGCDDEYIAFIACRVPSCDSSPGAPNATGQIQCGR
jgi:hypothetical protein